MRELTIIIQALSVRKLKYAREMLRQIHILDTNTMDPIFWRAYIANTLVNPHSLPFMFYEMDLLLDYQNGEFKRFQSDHGLSLKETVEMFKLHTLLVDALTKIRTEMNKFIIGRERCRQHSTKDALFDILSLAN